MNPKQPRLAPFAPAFLFLCVLFSAAPAAAQDMVTVGTVTASGNTVDVPVYVRDVSGTPLGRDQATGSKIQSFSITVNYAPSAAVQSVTFTRAGITAPLSTPSEGSPGTSGQITWFASFDESTNLVPFNLNAPAPGDQIAHLVFTLAPSAAPGSSITLTLGSETLLSNQAGTTGEAPPGSLTLVNGAINIPQLSLQILPSNRTVETSKTATLTAQVSRNVAGPTTVTLSSSNPGIATVPPSVVIPTGVSFADFEVTGVSIGSVDVNANLSASDGGATASAFITVAAPCDTPAAPNISGPSTSDAGKAYTISWPAINGATDYTIDESTDPNFLALTQTIKVTPGASFNHATANRYYYRVRARNLIAGCSTQSLFSNVISVLVSAVPVAQTRILAVVGSTPGSNNSYFKTSVQLYNARSSAISGKIVFHTQQASGSSSDPSLAFSIQPGKTLSYPDLLPAMGIASGLGSADLIADAGSGFPTTLVRVFNDAGAAGTTGLAEEPLALSDALQNGDVGSLIAPADQKFRLNIGVRTLDQGASMILTVRDKDGAVVKTTVTKTFGPNFFIQSSSLVMLDGYVLTGGETITIQMTAGSAFVYGSTTDNTTQDPSVQFARRIE